MTGYTNQDDSFLALVRAIAAADDRVAGELLAGSPELSRRAAARGATRHNAVEFFLAAVGHHLYAGDTALHIAAAAYSQTMASALLANGADVRARNRRGAGPLHYAADGTPGSPRWNPAAQAAVIRCLLQAGADPDCADRSGVTPLHRAVRTRCSAAVRTLLEGGADPRCPNGNGSTPAMLARTNTGRGGTGTAVAKAEQLTILQLLAEHGAA